MSDLKLNEQADWFLYLDHGMQDLVRVAFLLYEREMTMKDGFHDYSFVVFPMAKAYEGFVKKFLYESGIISPRQYRSQHFRIGRSLNPDLPVRYRRGDWVVEKLNQVCGKIDAGEWQGRRLSFVLWNEWKKGRNLLFHFFPDHVHFITLEEARVRLERMVRVMEIALSCEAFYRGEGKSGESE